MVQGSWAKPSLAEELGRSEVEGDVADAVGREGFGVGRGGGAVAGGFGEGVSGGLVAA